MAKNENIRHVILMCAAVNEVDLSALEALEKINDTLRELDIQLHLSEVKGPIMDRLGGTGFFKALSGNNYLSHNQAVVDLQQRLQRQAEAALADEQAQAGEAND